jgi:hypothetical protein
MAKGEARGLTARRAAFVCHRNSQGKMYRHARHGDLEGLSSHAATVTPHGVRRRGFGVSAGMQKGGG